MKSLAAIVGCVFALSLAYTACAGTFFTTPVIYVKPSTLNFGLVATNSAATNSFLVENMGRGRLVGKATVKAPFKILSGGEYSLAENEVQIITVTYKPSATGSDKQTVEFTGGGGAKATVTGKGGLPPEKKSKRK